MKRTIVFLLLLIGSACKTEKPLEKNIVVGEAMGTTYAITYFARGQINFQKDIDFVFGEVYQSMSTYISNSDISQINNGDSTIVVDEMFKEVFAISKEVYKISNGYFDPTVGVLVDAWGFGPGNPMVMNKKKVDSLLQYVGFDKVQITEDGTIKKSHPDIKFDFNAVAKGYAIDRIGILLDDKGIDNYLIEVGGEILTKGTNLSSQKDWTVGVDDPQNLENRGSAALIAVKDRALASSGNYRKFRIDELTGEKYVHIVDPKTGFTKNSTILATTVLADDCATADALATAFMVMELKDTKFFLINQSEIDAFIIYLDDEGNTQQFKTAGFLTTEI